MHWLRRTPFIARCVLAWLVLAMGVASASPLVHPQSMELVCGASGELKLVMAHDDGSVQERGQHTLDCALCLPGGAPPPVGVGVQAPQQQSLAHAVRPVEAARLASLVGAPLPARGPPAHSVI